MTGFCRAIFAYKRDFFPQFVRVTVDKCKGAPVMEGRRRRAVEDISQCSSTARMRDSRNK